MFGSEGAISFNLLLRSHPPDEPMHADSIGIRRVEASNVGQGSLHGLLLLRVTCGISATPFQEVQERFVRQTVIHLSENVVNLRKKITTGQAAFTEAPRFTGH